MSRRSVIMAVALAFHVLAGVFLYLRMSHKITPPPAAPVVVEVRDRPQSQRVDDFREQVRSYDTIEKCEAGLNDEIASDFDIVFDVAAQSQDFQPQMSFAQVLADRRAARLYSLLLEKGAADAKRLSVEIFQRKLDFHRSEMEFGVNEWLDNGKASRPFWLYRNQHAALCLLLICSQFCSPETIVEMTDRWEAEVRPVMNLLCLDARCQTDQRWFAMKHELTLYGCPEDLYLINLYCNVLCDDRKVAIDQIPGLIGWKTMPKTTPTPWHEWDASVNSFDFAHNHWGIEVDKIGVLRNFHLMRSWRPSIERNRPKMVVALREAILKGK